MIELTAIKAIVFLFIGAAIGALTVALAAAARDGDRNYFWTPTDDKLLEWQNMLRSGAPLTQFDQLDLIECCQRLKRANVELMQRAVVAEDALEMRERRSA